jgi:hypothetical protein
MHRRRTLELNATRKIKVNLEVSGNDSERPLVVVVLLLLLLMMMKMRRRK